MDTGLVVPSRVRSAASLLARTGANDDSYLEADDSAFYVLTDFRREYPITVDADDSIDEALADMNRLGVHALLVTPDGPEVIEARLVGLITAYDIERRRPHRFPGVTASKQPGRVKVSEVMTPCNELSLIKYESLQTLTALDIYRMFQGTGLTHLLVIEIHSDESAVARGLLSRAAVSKRLRRVRSADSR